MYIYIYTPLYTYRSIFLYIYGYLHVYVYPCIYICDELVFQAKTVDPPANRWSSAAGHGFVDSNLKMNQAALCWVAFHQHALGVSLKLGFQAKFATKGFYAYRDGEIPVDFLDKSWKLEWPRVSYIHVCCS